jgi:hypothetical protein
MIRFIICTFNKESRDPSAAYQLEDPVLRKRNIRFLIKGLPLGNNE